MVEQIAAASADPLLGNRVPPGTSEAGSPVYDAKALHGVDPVFIEIAAAIEFWRASGPQEPAEQETVGRGIFQDL